MPTVQTVVPFVYNHKRDEFDLIQDTTYSNHDDHDDNLITKLHNRIMLFRQHII